jgi:hypothetical protein
MGRRLALRGAGYPLRRSLGRSPPRCVQVLESGFTKSGDCDFIPDVYITAEAGQTPLADVIFPDPRGGHMFQDMCKKGVPTPAPYQFIAALVDKMLEKGYSEEDCGKVIGGNVYRVFKQVWK